MQTQTVIPEALSDIAKREYRETLKRARKCGPSFVKAFIAEFGTEKTFLKQFAEA